MAAANESQGLKIAVAAFVSLTVILAVTSYFMYSNYSQSVQKQADAEKKSSDSQRTAQTALTQLGELRTLAGYQNVEDFEALKTNIKKDQDKLLGDLATIDAETRKFVAEYQAAGGADAKIKELVTAAQGVAAALRDEPNKTLSSSLARLEELLKSQTLLAHAYATDNLSLRKNLESIEGTTKAKVDEQEGANRKSKEDLDAEHNDHEKARQDLLAKVDKLQTELSNLNTEYESFKTKTNLMREDYEKKVSDFRSQIAFYRDERDRTAEVMDRPDGVVTAIDYTRKEVHVNVTRQMGARPQMILAIFDQRLPIPNDHPKAHVELIQIDERGAIGRILPPVRTAQSLQSSADIPEPIKVGDYIYSASWSPSTPTRFALIGKIDMDRDGRDDREDLKRLLRASGGIIEYDLPPPGAGKESGKLTALCAYYVVDERLPLSIANQRPSERITVEESDFLKRQTEAMREARALGIRPLPIERLLTWMGYTPFMTTYGRIEHFDKKTSDSILYPRGKPVQMPAESETPPAAPGGEAAPAAEGAPANGAAEAPNEEKPAAKGANAPGNVPAPAPR